MKKTQLIDAIRNIQKRFVSYLSIVFIIMMATGGFLMTRYTGKAIEDGATEFFQDQNMKDFELVSSVGITEEDLNRIRAVEGVSDAEGVIVLDGELSNGDSSINAELVSDTNKISVPYLVEGALPEALNECAVGDDLADQLGLSVGDQVTLSADELLGADPLKESTFIVTGIMKHPDYVRSKMTWSVLLSLDAFDREALEGRYTRAFVTSEDADQKHMFRSAYISSTDNTRKKLTNLLPDLEESSLDDAKRLAEKRIDEEWEKGQAQIEDARKQIEDGKAELEEKLAEAHRQLNAARAQLNSARAQLISGEAQLRDAEAFLSALHQIRSFMAQTSAQEMRWFISDVNSLMDAYEYAQTDEERATAKTALIAYLDQDGNRGKVAVIKETTGVDLRKSAENPSTYPAAREVLRESAAVFMLLEAEDNGTQPQDLLTTADQLDKKLTAIENASDEEARAEARADLARLLEDPTVQSHLYLMNEYIGISSDELWYIAYGEGPLDPILLNRLHAVQRQSKRIRNSILNAEAMVAQGRAKLNAGWAMYYDGLRQLSEKEKEVETLELEARQKIEDAENELNQKIEEAEAELEKARARVRDMTSVWILEERAVNRGFFDVKSSTRSAYNIGYALGGLFLLVSALVCFSTLVIIIEEETKLVGTSKAFGFKNNEILMKYLVFGCSAAVFGCILGILMACGISAYVESVLVKTDMYSFRIAGIHPDIVPTILVCAGAILLCGLVTTLACSGLLKGTAYQLMNGLSNSSSKKKTAKNTKHGSLYSRLIIRNMLNEKARVAISMIIIGGSCCIIGIGISMKLAFDGMTKKELSDITVYDYRIDFDSTVTGEEQKELEEKLKSAGISFLPARKQVCLFNDNGKLNGLTLVSTDEDRIQDFIHIRDVKTGKPIELPESGLLIQNRLHESFGIDDGDEIKLYDNLLENYDAKVSGQFLNYQGRVVVCSEEAYEEIFGDRPVTNCYYVLLNGADAATLSHLVGSVSSGFAMEKVDSYLDFLTGTFMLYNIIVVISITIAVIMSFIILTNLANIFLNRKKKELIVMRINGFSIKQAIDYLKKETIITAAVGLLLGLLIGIVLTPALIRILEPEDAMFVRSTHWIAWIIAVALEALFTFVINASVFQKVKKLNFHDIL